MPDQRVGGARGPEPQTGSGRAKAVTGFLRDHPELLVVGAILAGIQLFPGGIPEGVYGLGIVSGSYLALHALGVIIVYRSNRIVNFAQVQTGVVAATLFAVLVQYQPLLRALTAVCPGCRLTSGLVKMNYWASMVLALAFGMLLAYAVYIFVIKRFARAPRLVATVATIFLAQLLGGVQGMIPATLTTEDQRLGGTALAPARLPFDWQLRWEPARFDASQIALVVAAGLAVVALTAYFRFTPSGTAIRAAGEDAARAETLGVKATALTARVWVVAGALSAVAGIISAVSFAPSGQASLDVGGTVRILAVALIGGMASLPLAAAGALAVGILFQSLVWAYGTNVLHDAVLFVLIAVLLLIKNRRAHGAELEQASGWRAARQVRPIPAELRSLPLVKGCLGAGGVLGAGALLGLPWALSPGQANLAALGLIYAVVGMSLLVLAGWVGHVSLGQFAVAAIGAYAAAALRLPFLLALPVASLAGALAAAAIAIPSLRLRGLHLAVITLSLALAVPVVLLNPTYLGRYLPDALRRPSLAGVNLEDERSFYYFCLIGLALVIAGVAGLRRSRMARALIAGRDNERAAHSLGIDLVRARLQAYAVAGSLAGLAGALYAFHQSGVRPTAFAPELSVTMFVMAVLGGLGSIAGPLIGALYIGTLTILSATPLVVFLATGGGGLLLLLFLPGGLGQLVFDLRDSFLRRLAERRGIAVPSLVPLQSDRHGRAPIAPRRPAGGRHVLVPPRYRLSGQWAGGGGLPSGAVPAEYAERDRG